MDREEKDQKKRHINVYILLTLQKGLGQELKLIVVLKFGIYFTIYK